MTAIETCHDLVLASKGHERELESDDPVSRYAGALVNAPQIKGARSMANQKDATPFYGYYFRTLPKPGKGVGSAFIAYPAESRSSGVMTFAITQGDIVYAADLGLNTAKIAQAMTTWKPSSKWCVAD